MTNREDVDYLLGADPQDFTVEEARDARDLLEAAINDISFQLDYVTADTFDGVDFDKWRRSAGFKKNKMLQAKRQFNNRYEDLWQESFLGEIKELIFKALIDNDEGAKAELIEICTKP